MKQRQQYNDLEHLELVARRIAEGGVDITREYQDWISVTFACASLGEAARESYHTICRQYPDYKREECDAKFDNCLRTGRGDITLGTLLQLAKDNGIDTSLPRGPRPRTEAERKEERENRFRLMRQQIEEWYEVRFNTWKNRPEMRLRPDGPWEPIRDRDLCTLFARLQEQGLSVRQSDVKALLESRTLAHDYDAVAAWLGSLTPYDPQSHPDYIHDLFTGHLVYVDAENAEFYQQMLQKWFVGMVALWTGRTDENPIMPVLCGPQHIGKTYFIRHLLPPALRPYYKEPNPADPVDKDFIISLSEVVMIFLDEFTISSDLKSDSYKAIISSSQSNLRDAYGHFREVRQRKASLIGATNHSQFIRDSEGNRRYLGVNLKETLNLTEYPLPYEGAYAQALWLLENGFQPKPTQEESAAITEHNRTFMVLDDCEAVLATLLRRPAEGDCPQAYSAGDLMQVLENRGFRGKAYNANNIGKAMKKMGFEVKITKKGNRYLAVLVTPMERECQRIAEAAEEEQKTF
ncbi:MAG: PriCT-2 domain-containing protein [Bacteroidaceae bacterium]|nr:PriCT-2 domain-containing protein [Bacteroidaceae bacterium]